MTFGNCTLHLNLRHLLVHARVDPAEGIADILRAHFTAGLLHLRGHHPDELVEFLEYTRHFHGFV